MSTPEDTIQTDDAITKMRFRLDALKERVRRIWAAVHGDPDRGPDPDYTPFDDERRILIDIIRRQTSGAGGSYHEAPRGSNAIVIGCTVTILSAFIVGAWKLSNDQAAFVAQVTEWQKSVERRIEALERR